MRQFHECWQHKSGFFAPDTILMNTHLKKWETVGGFEAKTELLFKQKINFQKSNNAKQIDETSIAYGGYNFLYHIEFTSRTIDRIFYINFSLNFSENQ